MKAHRQQGKDAGVGADDDKTEMTDEQTKGVGSADTPAPMEGVLEPITSMFRPHAPRAGEVVYVIGVCCRSCRLDWEFNGDKPQHQACPRCASMCTLVHQGDELCAGSTLANA